MLSMSLCLGFVCSWCQQLMEEAAAKRDTQRMALFGAKKYAICLNCYQEVNYEDQTPQYKRRWTLRFKKLTQTQTQEENPRV